nr:hypothetical protein GW17_00021639 [Ipomoea trifida]
MHPLLPLLEPVNRNRLRNQLVRAPPISPRIIIHRRLIIEPVLRLLPHIQPLPHQLILRPVRIIRRNPRPSDPLHQIPRQHKPHPRHVTHERVHARTRNHETVVQIPARQPLQRRRQRRQAQEHVIVGLHDVIVPKRQDSRQGREIRVRLAAVHVLGAIKDDDVAEAQDFEGHERPLLLAGEVAEYELHVDARERGGLDAVDEAEEMAALVLFRPSEDPDQESESCMGICGHEHEESTVNLLYS